MTFREALNYPLEQSDPSPQSYHNSALGPQSPCSKHG